jgi:hypothetical protein
MLRHYSLVFACLFAVPFAAHAGPQVCTLGASAAGSQGTLLCRDAYTGAPAQTIALGNTVTGKGGTGGTLSRHGNTVLVTNQSYGALVFKRHGSSLTEKSLLDTHGEGTYSGAAAEKGNYVVTATKLYFFPNGHSAAQSSQPLLIGDGSVAQVAVSGDFAYVSEKSGTLEAFRLGADGSLTAPGATVGGVPPGTIVGITALQDLVVAPVAHLAFNANQSAIPIVSGPEAVRLVETKEVAACWAANDGEEACISNPGSMTISCGAFGPGGFRSYTSAAAHLVGDSLLDLDVDSHLVAAVGTFDGMPYFTVFTHSKQDGDFLSPVSLIPLDKPVTTGALLLPE